MASGSAPAVQQQQAVPVDTLQYSGSGISDGQLFGLPGVTVWSEQKENNDNTVTALASAAQSTALFNANFKQTDIVFRWDMGVNYTAAYSVAPTTIGPYFPYNIIGPAALNIQNQFNTINVESGIDMAIFQAIRPSRSTSYMNWVDQNLIAVDSYSNATPTLITSNAYTAGSTSMTWWLEMMPCISFDLYYDLGEDGRLYNNAGAMGIRAYVTPQMMAGTNRVIQPAVTYNSLINAANLYTSPFANGTLTSASVTLNFRRTVVYQPTSSAAAPLLFNWQYARETRRITISGVSSIDIPLPLVGQILMFYIRMWDPTLNAGAGGAIPITNLTNAWVQIGSGLYRFQDTPTDAVKRLYRQHGIFLPAGCLAWDMAITDDGRITNRNTINTLTTSGTLIHLDFTASQNNGAFVVLGVESLRYVSLQ
jgi:hypothetical protein